MILCNLDNNWYLSTGWNVKLGQFGVRCGLQMPHPETFQDSGTCYYGTVKDTARIVFYPTLRFLDCLVWPWNGWRNDTHEPILHCMMGNWWTSPNEPEAVSRERKRRLIEEFGWGDGGRDGLGGFVHVDQLEKTEGPPPEGPF